MIHNSTPLDSLTKASSKKSHQYCLLTFLMKVSQPGGVDGFIVCLFFKFKQSVTDFLSED